MYFGTFAGYKVLIMTKTGPALYDLQKKTRFGRFGMKTISQIAIQGVIQIFLAKNQDFFLIFVNLKLNVFSILDPNISVYSLQGVAISRC